MALKYVLSQKDEKLLVYKNVIHRKEKNNNEKIIRKCNDYKNLNFRGRVYTKGDSIIKYTDHTYKPISQ